MKNKAHRKTKKQKRMTDWIFIQSLPILAATILSTSAIQIVDNLLNGIIAFDIFRALGMVIPMSAFLGLVTYFTAKSSYKYVSPLIEGIGMVAQGNFNIKLNIEKVVPVLEDAYENFNKMVSELQSAQILRNDFINNFSHEFKTPITSINGFAKLLLKRDVSEEDRIQYLNIITNESERLSNLANSTILLSNLDSQKIIPDKRMYLLDEQLRQCSILLSPQWSKKNIDLSIHLPETIYCGNPEIMQHIWINLLSNAIKFTPENGTITINIKKESDIISILISDTGKGMNEDEISRVFDKYYQGDTSHSTSGLGLGLSIARRIIELCDGKIEVQSIVNKGSTFTVLLPCH